ncbi:hypothetical protein OAK06_02190 [Gammaproteobacteria bacterium]|nr:hypothetical protein [Gammaproteobacteria bacterium]
MNTFLFSSSAKILLGFFLIIQTSSALSDNSDKAAVKKLLEGVSCNPKFTAVTKRVEKKVFKLGSEYAKKTAGLNEEIEDWVINNQLTCFERYNLTFFYALNLYRNGNYDTSEKLLIKLLDYKIPSENNSKIIKSRLNKVQEKREEQIAALRIKELNEDKLKRQADIEAQRKQRAIEAKRQAAIEEKRQADLKAQRMEEKQKQAAATREIKIPTEQKRKQEVNSSRASSSPEENISQPQTLSSSSEVLKTKNCQDKESNQTKASGRSGIKKRCYEDGTLFSSTSYIEGKKDGLEEIYFKNGKLKNKKYFVQGKLNGPEELYVLESRLDKEGNQLRDWEGILIKNYYLLFKGSYLEGSKEGKHIFYHPNKQISRIENYKKGVFDGEIRSFFSDGLLKEKFVYKKGVFDGPYEKYKENGQPIIKLTYKNGQKNGLEEIYSEETGQLSYRTNFLKDKVDGNFEEYYPDGVIKLSGKFNRGKRAGEWEAYYPDGTLAIRSLYRSGKIQGPLEEYYEDGILKKITNYSFGKRNGLEENFDKNGIALSSKKWKSGKEVN